jgi:hypothetical protein
VRCINTLPSIGRRVRKQQVYDPTFDRGHAEIDTHSLQKLAGWCRRSLMTLVFHGQFICLVTFILSKHVLMFYSGKVLSFPCRHIRKGDRALTDIWEKHMISSFFSRGDTISRLKAVPVYRDSRNDWSRLSRQNCRTLRIHFVLRQCRTYSR